MDGPGVFCAGFRLIATNQVDRRRGASGTARSCREASAAAGSLLLQFRHADCWFLVKAHTEQTAGVLKGSLKHTHSHRVGDNRSRESIPRRPALRVRRNAVSFPTETEPFEPTGLDILPF